MERIMLITPQENPIFTQDHLDFLVENHQVKTPHDMALILGKNKQTIYRHLKKYGLTPCVNRITKYRKRAESNAVIAGVIEDYVTTMAGLDEISKRHKIDRQKISRWISRHYLGSHHDENSMVITLESAI